MRRSRRYFRAAPLAMVAIVIVSHSAAVAEGAAELARQMGGAAPIETAGGLDEPGNPLGTDAALVLAAIERAYSDDGVLVLMDLGSAVMSAELAVEMLEPARQARVRLSAAPLVEGAVTAVATAGTGATLEEVAREVDRSLEAKAEHLRGDSGGSEGVGDEPEEGPGEPQGDGVVAHLVIHNPTGLHARPAARFVKTASAFGAQVMVTNLTKGKGPANARSLVSVTTLGVSSGDTIKIEARGDGAKEVISALEALAGRNFDE